MGSFGYGKAWMGVEWTLELLLGIRRVFCGILLFIGSVTERLWLTLRGSQCLNV